MKNLIVFFIATALLCCTSSNDNILINPKKDILGKWELIQQGTSLDNLLDVEPSSGHTEFLDESSYRIYNDKTGEFDDGNYTLNDSLLIYYYYAVDQANIDTISVRYYYTFRNPKTLVLDIDALAINDFFVYKKIE